MKFRLEIDTRNDAFGEDEMDRGGELAAQLRRLADYLEANGAWNTLNKPIRDANGNTVGNARIGPR